MEHLQSAKWTTNWFGTVMSQQYTIHHAAMVIKNDTFANVKVHGQDQRQAPVYTATPTIYTSPALDATRMRQAVVLSDLVDADVKRTRGD
eukprot:scaffold132403_cov23-Cyclotella_meneghiniana.AAC.1